jgi:hypothetical protein
MRILLSSVTHKQTAQPPSEDARECENVDVVPSVSRYRQVLDLNSSFGCKTAYARMWHPGGSGRVVDHSEAGHAGSD